MSRGRGAGSSGTGFDPNTPSDDIGWKFGKMVENNRNKSQCIFCGKIVSGGITRLKEHLAHKKGQVSSCPSVSGEVWELMMKHLKDYSKKQEDKRKRHEELKEQIRATQCGEEYEYAAFNNDNDDSDLEMTIARQESAAKQKLGRAVSQFVLYTRLSSNTVNSPWLEPMLDVAREVGKGTKLPSSYEVVEVYLPKEYDAIQKWIGSLKTTWEERGVSIMCDGWSGPRRRHLVNFLVYSNRGTVFHKSIDATDVLSRTADYYFGLMDKVVEEIGEQYIVQIITDNEAAMKAAGYFLNPIYQYGGNLSNHREVMDGVRKVIMRLLPDLNEQVEAINQISVFRNKEDTLGTIVAQAAVQATNPAEWWIHYGVFASQLQQVAVKVLSQTTSSSNCERNWSTFSLIHTKTRNRLKYQKLNKIVYVYYNMRLKIRHATRRSDEERDDHFNPINLDYIFDEDDPLAEWLQEEEHAILDDVDNSEWLDTGDTQNPQNVDPSENSSSGGRGLSPFGSGSEDDDGPNGSVSSNYGIVMGCRGGVQTIDEVMDDGGGDLLKGENGVFSWPRAS
ncbi:hypothetical protein RHSIM_Rhsim05G0096600 [Rhododendron simsii]|uniref:BED-type domain-containing protein n=1 Tax=Rhododendron simsii TaxID=118357 RepID=A0A834GZQ8_RHOSS|nr:hypothetical protein RHSIM_Rhsim05G0096600 [Rhododendron simsii]